MPHEIFHQLQFIALPKAHPWVSADFKDAVVEGGAELAVDLVDPVPKDYAFAGKSFFRRETISFVSELSRYADGLFWKFSEEQGSNAAALAAYVELLKCVNVYGYNVSAKRHWQRDLVCDTTSTSDDRSDVLWGQFLVALRLQEGGSHPPGDHRYYFADGDAPIGVDRIEGSTLSRYATNAFSLRVDDQIDIGRAGELYLSYTSDGRASSSSLQRWSARFHQIRLAVFPPPRRIKLSFLFDRNAVPAGELPLIRVLRLGKDARLLEQPIVADGANDWTLSACDATELVVIVAARDESIDYKIDVSEVE